MSYRAALGVASVAFGLTGCDASASPEPDPAEPSIARSLVAADRWVDSVADPFAEHQPDTIACGPEGYRVEPLGLEIDTGLCNYLLVEQPLMSDVAAGESIEIVAFHDELAAPSPAEGHVALAIGDTVIWDTRVPIPSPAAPFGVRIDFPHDVAAGTPVVLHLHNHGVNDWTLLDVRVDAP